MVKGVSHNYTWGVAGREDEKLFLFNLSYEEALRIVREQPYLFQLQIVPTKCHTPRGTMHKTTKGYIAEAWRVKGVFDARRDATDQREDSGVLRDT